MSSLSTPAAALAALRRGNDRYVTARARHPRQDAAARRDHLVGQAPHTCVLACADSRVSPEVIFDQGIGDLFVVRNGGQVLTPSAAASVEFAYLLTHVKAIVVLGHEGCKAVALGRAIRAGESVQTPGQLAVLTDAVTTYLANDDGGLFPTVGAVVARIRALEVLADPLRTGDLVVVGAGYHLGSGQVEWLES
ncbi:MAG: carbonic anhydrase [Bowdeniella nasicola]|nr:carbonic anhydrase [Bowdeniella nasicola]